MNFKKILGFVAVAALAFAYSGAKAQGEYEMVVEEEATLLAPDSLDYYSSYAETDDILRAAVVMSDIYGKKDMEFTRGLLLGMQQSGLPANSVSLKLINGEIPEDSLHYELDNFDPHVIFSTSDKECPLPLLNYTRSHGNKLFNVFDAKGDEYLYNNNVYQLLTPSLYFNTSSANYFLQRYPENVLLVVGDLDPSDTLTRELILAWPEEYLMMISPEDLGRFSLDDNISYLIYPVSPSNDDVKAALNETLRLIGETPTADVRVIGRPSWISLNDLSNHIANMDVFIPSKIYFEPTSAAGKRFISDYNGKYGHSPIRSFPVFAVMGYDVAQYFLPRLVDERKGNEINWQTRNLLQSFFDMRKSGNGGYYNNGAYILHFTPWGFMQKDLLY
ncbi:MAG: hypothetical protein J1F07_00140 [Muribaculaceae bacterium]|nr:hypothetical protein [Muribaculaceae bacterium]